MFMCMCVSVCTIYWRSHQIISGAWALACGFVIKDSNHSVIMTLKWRTMYNAYLPETRKYLSNRIHNSHNTNKSYKHLYTRSLEIIMFIL